MKNNKNKFIIFGSIALVFAILVSSYIIWQNQNQNQYQSYLSAIMNNEGVSQYGTLTENEVTDATEYSSAEPAAKLDKIYEDAMENSSLQEFEKERIRSIVQNENKTFEEAVETVRPGSKVIQIQADTQTTDSELASEIKKDFVEPAAKLDKIYEDAMDNSDLQEFEKERIRSIVQNENKTFEEAVETVRPGSKVIQEQTEVQTANSNQNTQQPTTSSSNNVHSLEEKRAMLIEGIEKFKVKYPGYDKEWDIVANEFYTDEEILTSNPLDQLTMLKIYTEQRGGIPPIKYMAEGRKCDCYWLHMPDFSGQTVKHDPDECCICTPELEGTEGHEIFYYEDWSTF